MYIIDWQLLDEHITTSDRRKGVHNAVVSRAGARTGLQLQGHGDMQGLNSSSAARGTIFLDLCPPSSIGGRQGYVSLFFRHKFHEDIVVLWPNG